MGIMRYTATQCSLLLAAMLAFQIVADAAMAADGEAPKSSAEIRITLPVGGAHRVAVWPGNDRIVLELPGDAVFPLDFAASSGGMVRGGKIVPDGDRVRLELRLSRGLLSRIEYEPEAVVLVFESHFEADGDDGSDDEDRYEIGPEDKLIVRVHNFPDLDCEPTVTHAGLITVPLVGELRAAGHSPQGLGRRLTELLGSDYLVDPRVEVSVDEYNSQWVMVDGDARTAGRIPLRGGTRLKEILSEANGFAETAGEEIFISRKVEDSDTFETMTIDRKEFEAGRIDPRMRHGDIITISKTTYCYVQGEVASPSRVRIERGLTLLRAVTQVGGLTDWANRRKVRILSEGQAPRTYNLKQIQEGKAPDPELTGGDIVIVDRRFF